MTRVLSPARARACAQKVILRKVFSSVQINIFTVEKPFYLIFKDFSKLSLGKKTCREENDAYCFKSLARAMIITKFKQEPILN